jgi:hypothetical protein
VARVDHGGCCVEDDAVIERFLRQQVPLTAQSRSDAHLDLVVATGARHAVSLLHIDSVDCEQVAAFLAR